MYKFSTLLKVQVLSISLLLTGCALPLVQPKQPVQNSAATSEKLSKYERYSQAVKQTSRNNRSNQINKPAPVLSEPEEPRYLTYEEYLAQHNPNYSKATVPVKAQTQARVQPQAVIRSNKQPPSQASIQPQTQPHAKTSKLAKRPQIADITTEESHKTDLKQGFNPNIWNEMQGQFHLVQAHLGEFDSTIRYFKGRPDFLNRVSVRAKPYLHHIFSEVKRRNMPYEIALLPIVESSFRPMARSHQAAGGLWQFIPSTAQMYGLDQNWWFDGRQDTLLSTKAALDYLEKLYAQNNNDWLLALASYNGGIGNLRKAIKKYKKRHKNPKSKPNFWDLQPYLLKETRHYVPQLLGVSYVINHAEEFKIPLEPINNSPFFTEVKLDQQTTLHKVAKLANISKKDLTELNPGYLRPTTPPQGPFNLLLPVDKVDSFKKALASNKKLFDIQWIKHTIQPGDSLGVIAEKYNTSSRAIKRINNMRTSRIRTGKKLLIPIPAEFANQLKSITAKSKYTGPKKIHTVRAGESIWGIARYYNVNIRTLAKWNRIGVRSTLRKGQQLEIRSDRYGYTVDVALEKGESLWTLSRKYNVTTSELIRWNGIQKSKAIQPGTLLTIWQPNNKQSANNKNRQYKVQRGDNLWNIARANQVTAKHLARYNNLPLNGALQPGQLLRIPHKS